MSITVAPRSFYLFAILFLLWNLIGCAMFVQSYSRDLSTISDPMEAEMWRAMPGWMWPVYGVAVFGGLIGAIMLLARKRLAIALFALSLLMVVIQFGYIFGTGDWIARRGAWIAIGPAVIFAIGLVELLYARSAGRRAYLA